MSSVMLSLHLRMFAVTQALTLPIHDCIECSSSGILSGGAYICNCKSSLLATIFFSRFSNLEVYRMEVVYNIVKLYT